jgi:4-oxalocrotonate tautomerase
MKLRPPLRAGACIEEKTMPFVTVQLTREGTEPGVDSLTPAQKSAIFQGMSQVLLDVLGKPHAWTWVVIQEVDTADWGWGGMPVLEYRKQLAGEAE